MALATRCPHCNTTFRVASDQLKLRGGIVRCGACHEIFDGNQSLFDPDAAPELPAAAAPAAIAPAAAPLDNAPAAAVPAAAAVSPAAAAVSPAAVPAAETPRKVDLKYEPDPDFDVEPPPPPFNGYVDFPLDLIDEEIVPLAASAMKAAAAEPVPVQEPASVASPAAETAAGAPAAGEPAAAAPLHDEPLHDEPANDASVNDQVASDEAEPAEAVPDQAAPDEPAPDEAEPEPEPDPEPEPEPIHAGAEGYYDDPPDYYDDAPELTTPVALPLEGRHSVLPVVADGPLPLLRAASYEAPVTATAVPLPAPPKPKKKKSKPRPQAAPVPAPVPVPEPESDEPAFVRRGRELEQAGRTRRIALAAGSAVLAVALLAQGLTTFRNVLAASVPALKGPIGAVCAVAGCKIELPAEIDALSIETGELQTLGGNSFALTTALRNQSGLVQAWPHIELALTDANDNVLLRRIIAPSDYLPRGATAGKGFSARSEQPVKLQFEVSQVKASGYRIAIFYP